MELGVHKVDNNETFDSFDARSAAFEMELRQKYNENPNHKPNYYYDRMNEYNAVKEKTQGINFMQSAGVPSDNPKIQAIFKEKTQKYCKRVGIPKQEIEKVVANVILYFRPEMTVDEIVSTIFSSEKQFIIPGFTYCPRTYNGQNPKEPITLAELAVGNLGGEAATSIEFFSVNGNPDKLVSFNETYVVPVPNRMRLFSDMRQYPAFAVELQNIWKRAEAQVHQGKAFSKVKNLLGVS